ncbi:MAG: YqiA/YcfP family alpha/beta fold hydrolase [Kangiellaceae bacterium]|nr:YqiA/YcfP family alpha/beta fold hydrolase [Kangiellaceae bacterium]
MKVIFSHGKESGPWGRKIKRMAEIAQSLSYAVESIDYTDMTNPDDRVDRLLDKLRHESEDIILVGSSMGGYVSLVCAETLCVEQVLAEKLSLKGVFLLAPALYKDGYRQQIFNAETNIEIVHGWNDDVIPWEHSVRFAREANAKLHLVPGDHRLNDAITDIEYLFREFICCLDS